MVKRLNIGGDTAESNSVTPFPVQNKTVLPPVFEEPSFGAPVAASNPPPAIVATNIEPGKLPVTMEELGKMGAQEQTQVAAVTSRITGVAKTSDMDEMGKLINNTILAAKGYDPDNLFKGGFLGFFKAKSQQIRQKFDTVDQSVDRIVAEVDNRISLFRQRVQDLEQLAVANKQYHDALTPQIEQIQQMAHWMDGNVPTADPNDPLSAQFVQSWITVAGFAHKRADDLRRAQVLSQMQAAQIEQMKTNSSALAQKFADIKVTTIPAMKNTFVLYVINMEQKKGAEMSDQIDNLSDQAFKRNAELLGQNTTAIHTSLTRSAISMEALQANYNAITKSLDEVARIQTEMKQRIASEAPQLEQLSRDVTATVTRVR
jgi:uncharacterized protein YaaN involved in tellurite resistance